MSSGGVLLSTDADVQVGQPLEFLITLPTGPEGAHVRLRCMGKVVRLERNAAPAVAATLERFEFVRHSGN